jgi:putative ABC transport system substrate-binding protein
MRRRELMSLLGGAIISGARSACAEVPRIPLVGYLSIGPRLVEEFARGLSDGGFEDGRNVAIEYSLAQGGYAELPVMAAELVRRNVAVIAANGLAAAQAARHATASIPIVFVSGDPVAEGLVASLARPGGNLTGISLMDGELMPKGIDLLSTIVPRARKLALLVNSRAAAAPDVIRQTRDTAQAKRLDLEILTAASDQEIAGAFDSLPASHADGVVVAPDPFFAGRFAYFAALAERYAVPAIYYWSLFAWSGGLISYGPSVEATRRQLGAYAAKLLKGARPTDLPVEQPDRFELVINMKTAKTLGLAVPQSILALADQVIE